MMHHDTFSRRSTIPLTISIPITYPKCVQASCRNIGYFPKICQASGSKESTLIEDPAVRGRTGYVHGTWLYDSFSEERV